MTLNFESFISCTWLVMALLLAGLFLFLFVSESSRATRWKHRAKQFELERDQFAKKFFDVRDAEIAKIKMQARIEAARENQMERNLSRVLQLNETNSSMVAPFIRFPVPGSSLHTKRFKHAKPRGERNE